LNHLEYENTEYFYFNIDDDRDFYISQKPFYKNVVFFDRLKKIKKLL